MNRQDNRFVSAYLFTHFTEAGSFNILPFINAALWHLPSLGPVINSLTTKNMAMLINKHNAYTRAIRAFRIFQGVARISH
jgi:hypothetical protein